MQRIEKQFAGRKLIIETGRMAKQAAGSALVQFGDTMVLAAVTVSDNKARSPSSRSRSSTAKRPTPPARSPAASSSAKAARTTTRSCRARIIDRSIRPLFPEGFKNEVQVFVYVISADQENDADVLALSRRRPR